MVGPCIQSAGKKSIKQCRDFSSRKYLVPRRKNSKSKQSHKVKCIIAIPKTLDPTMLKVTISSPFSPPPKPVYTPHPLS